MDLESNYYIDRSVNDNDEMLKVNDVKENTNDSTVNVTTMSTPTAATKKEQEDEKLLFNTISSSNNNNNNSNYRNTLHDHHQQAETAFQKKALVLLSTISVVVLMMMMIITISHSTCNSNNKNTPFDSSQDSLWLFDRSLKQWPWRGGRDNDGGVGGGDDGGDTISGSNDPSRFNLDVVISGNFGSAFTAARDKWQGVITGDLPQVILNGEESECGSNLKGTVDDVYVCAFVKTIDGSGAVLGYAGPEYAREGGGHITPYLGMMVFDTEDVNWMSSQGILDKVIMHEMGHVLGIGTLWKDNGLQSSSAPWSCEYGANTRATSEYLRISRCIDATIPVERDGGRGTACGHWDEECFKGEIMTGYASGNMAMSTMTLASLEDMGYTVDYSRADPYSASDMASTCKCTGEGAVAGGATTFGGSGDLFSSITATTPAIGTNEQSVATKPEIPEVTPVGTEFEGPVETEPEEPAAEIPADVLEPAVPETAPGMTTDTSSSSSGEIAGEDATSTANDSTEPAGRQLKRRRRQLSASGEAAAREFGMSILQGNQANKNPGSGAGNIYVGSEMVVVIYEEAGEVYHILVN